MTKIETFLMGETAHRRILIANDFDRYTIKQIMLRFSVSRATAVRDRRAALDALGLFA